jgi:MFS family permease
MLKGRIDRGDWLRPILLVFLPFAAGYYLSYLFRAINAVVAEPLVHDLGLDATRLGFLSSVYFLTFAAVQLPVGAALDRFGPRRVQGTLLMLAAVGSVTFARATGLTGLLIGRGLIGLGVAGALMAGLKAIVEWFPNERLPLVNGTFIALGAAGAVTATAPAEWMLGWIDWRGLFLLLAAATAVLSLLILVFVLEPPKRHALGPRALNIRAIYTDARFWCVAPLSALCIGSAWALQGLWAAPWLADVAALERDEIVRHLFIMAVALCVGALLIGVVAAALRRRGVGAATVLSMAACLFIGAELALLCRVPLPSMLLWALVAGMGAATVLSYALIADLFPQEAAGRANAALNVLHIGAAFAIQAGIGGVVGLWPRGPQGHYPPDAYRAAFLVIVVLQFLALIWFLRPIGWGRKAHRKVRSQPHQEATPRIVQ